ncbi:MAG: secreted protein [Acidimicrobiaceae bacterium]|nr:secreted protein [Acidimicrobiaceae bacterium]
MPSDSPVTSKKPFARLAALGSKRLAIIGGVVVVVVGAILGIVLSGSTAKKTPAATPASTSTAPATTQPALAANVCPLTDTPAPGGVVPRRPALAVKVGNEPQGARPQSGLNEADVVYDTPAEGGIMRYVAIYQCKSAAQIGPTRSVRWVDWHILAMYRNLPLLVHAGGINPDIASLNALRYVKNVDLLNAYASDGVRTTNRTPPDNLYTSTAAAWASFKNEKTPPTPVFKYTGALPSSATAAASIEIDFSIGTHGIWTWNGSSKTWVHSYAGAGPDIDALTNKQVSTNNVIVQVVKYALGPYAESTGGSGDVESIMTGTGRGYVLRNGKEIPVTWHRPSLGAETTFTDSSGQQVGLTRGRTFVEIVLDTTASQKGAITITK